MAANVFHVQDTRKAVQYDGTNSTDILAAFGFSAATLSEAAGVWTFEVPAGGGTVWVVNTNDYIVFAQNTVFGTFSPSSFAFFFTCDAVCEDLAGFTGDVTALDSRLDTAEADIDALEADVASLQAVNFAGVKAIGVAPVPTLLLGASTTVAVTLQPAMPDATYSAYASKFAGISLTDLNITSVTVIDADTVNVGVQNVGLATITGATVLVHAID